MTILRRFAEQNDTQHSLAKPKVIIDSNVWVSAIVFGGDQQRCIELAYNVCTVVVTEDILSEILRVLKENFAPSYRLLRALRTELDAKYIAVELDNIPIRDAKDEHLIRAAKQLGVRLIVSGDKDLLEYIDPNILIIRAAEFIDLSI